MLYDPREHHNNVNSPWSQEGVAARMAQLWIDGISCSNIARILNTEFGTKFTRNAIIGRADRNNFPKRKIAPVRRFGKTNRKRIEPPKKAVHRNGGRGYWHEPLNGTIALTKARHIADSEIPLEQRKTVFTLGPHDCRFPVGEVGKPDFFFCGAPALDKRPYCACHCARAFRPSEWRAAA